MTLFHLLRNDDETGISGTGVVADGVIFRDGKVALRWRPGPVDHQSTVIYDSIEAVQAIHGHGGKTKVVFGEGDQRSHGAEAMDDWIDKSGEIAEAMNESPASSTRSTSN